MSIPRFFMEDDLPEEGTVKLPLADKELHHMLVRRIEPGEHIACCCAGGRCWEVELVEIDKTGATGFLVGTLPIEKVPNLTLVQGISKGDRMGQTIRQTTELGIAHIIPYLAERSIVRLAVDERAGKGERWRRIALSAAKQSGRTILPLVEDPRGLKEVCEELTGYDRILIAWEEADSASLSIGAALEETSFGERVALIIGPEGGLSAKEIETFRALGSSVRTITLGDLILRTETAGTIATALCMYELGGLGNTR